MAPLVNVEVVGFAEGTLAPPAVVGFGHRSHLDRASSVEHPGVVDVDAAADGKHLCVGG